MNQDFIDQFTPITEEFNKKVNQIDIFGGYEFLLDQFKARNIDCFINCIEIVYGDDTELSVTYKIIDKNNNQNQINLNYYYTNEERNISEIVKKLIELKITFRLQYVGEK